MNTAIDPVQSYGQKDFASKTVTSEHLQGRMLEIWPSEAQALLSASLSPTGIAESVSQLVIRRSATLSPTLRRRMGELSDLKANWDGEGAKAVKSHVLADVVEALKRLAQRPSDFREPFLAPTFDGFAQLEWHDKKRSLEIEATNQGWSVVGTMVGVNSKRHYYSAECDRSDFAQLERFYEWFLGSELIWPSL